jgi:hypothetical protein
LREILFQKVADFFYAVFVWFDLLTTVPCRSKHVGIRVLDVIQYKYIRDNFVHFNYHNVNQQMHTFHQKQNDVLIRQLLHV